MKKSLFFLSLVAFAFFTGATVCGCIIISDESVESCAQICSDSKVNDKYNLVHYGEAYGNRGGLGFQQCVQAYGQLVYDHAKSQRIPDALHELFQIIYQESNCNIDAVGNNGLPKDQSRSWGCGLMQIESIHQGSFGGVFWPADRNPDYSPLSCFAPTNNVMMGVSIYARYTSAMGGDPVLGMCAYNKGVTGARNYGLANCISFVASTYGSHDIPPTETILGMMRSG